MTSPWWWTFLNLNQQKKKIFCFDKKTLREKKNLIRKKFQLSGEKKNFLGLKNFSNFKEIFEQIFMNLSFSLLAADDAINISFNQWILWINK